MLTHNGSGGYRFLGLAGRPFSAGAVADEGHDLVHARFERPLPLQAGLAAAARHVAAAGRPIHSIAGFELRIPKPLSGADFDTFNQWYVKSLKGLGLEVDGLLPAGRTNVAVAGAVSEPSVYAVTYTIPAKSSRRAFVLSGAPEEQPGDAATMIESIMRVLSGRLEKLGVSWEDATAIQLYGIDEIDAGVVDRLVKKVGGSAVHGVQYFPSLPPVAGLKLEVDVRSAGTELVLRGA
jgi:hypothetical protein